MKQIEAVINRFKLPEVLTVLEEQGISDVMETAVLCHRKGQTMMFRGATFVASIVEKVKLEIIAADEAVAGIIEAIGSITRSGGQEECRIAVRTYIEAV